MKITKKDIQKFQQLFMAAGAIQKDNQLDIHLTNEELDILVQIFTTLKENKDVKFG